MVLVANEEAKMEACYYEICNDYPEAWVDGNVCTCYEYDFIGNLVAAKTELMK